MSSKRAGAKAGRALLIYILGSIASGTLDHTKHPKKIKYLLRYGYLSKTGQSRLFLTPKGKFTLSEADIWDLAIPTPSRWDRQWHLALFDIPNDKRKRRDIFRTRLKGLGLVLYQNSVWIHPYPIEKIVRQVAEFYKLTPCVSFIMAEQLTGEKKLRQQFGLK